DSNGDGFSDAFDTAFGLNPSDPSQTPVPPGTQVGSLAGAKMNVKLNFAKKNSDSLSLSGELAIPKDFKVSGAKLGLAAGDLIEVFTLDAKGKAKSGSGTVSVSIKSTKGSVAAQNAKFTIKLSKDNLADDLNSSGLTDGTVANQPVTISVTVVLSQSDRV